MLGDIGRIYRRLETTLKLSSERSEAEPVKQTVTLLDYINREDVRKAFHVPDKVPAYRPSYENLTYLPNFEGTSWVYQNFYKYGYKMIHMMADTDGILSTRGMWKWLDSVPFPVTQKWTPWLTPDENVIGYTKLYGNFSLATIHGEGHSGLLIKINESSRLVRNFINDLPLTS